MWKPCELGDVIAGREFVFESANGEKKELRLKIGRPVKGPESDDPFFCAYQIEGLSDSNIMYAAGEDSLQALTLALEALNVLLPEMEKKKGGKFKVHGSDQIPLIFQWSVTNMPSKTNQ